MLSTDQIKFLIVIIWPKKITSDDRGLQQKYDKIAYGEGKKGLSNEQGHQKVLIAPTIL